MGLLNKKPNYADVVHFVTHLSETEYQKLTKVVRTYRGAEKSVRAVLGGKLSDYQLEYEEIGEVPKTAKGKKGGR
jgi:hypothetical protein